jgi:hypothetical protein
VRKKKALVGLVFAMGLACALLVLLPESGQAQVIETIRGPEPNSTTETFLFQFERDSPEITLWLSTNLLVGEIAVEILDSNGKVLWLPYELDKREYQCLTIRPERGFGAGRSYQLRVTERRVVGRYKIVVARQEASTVHQRYFQIGVLSALAIGAIVVYSRF